MSNNANDTVANAGLLVEDKAKILNRQRNLILFIVALDIVILLCSYDINTIFNTIGNIGNTIYNVLYTISNIHEGPLTA